MTALAMVFGALALLPMSYFNGGLDALPSFGGSDWAAVIFLGSFASAMQFSLFTWALRWLPPTTTVLYLALSPVTAMVLGVLLIGEVFTPTLLVGLVIVLTGIVVGNGVITKLQSRQSIQ